MKEQKKAPQEDKVIRVGGETHRILRMLAARRGVTIKEVTEQVLEDYLKSATK